MRKIIKYLIKSLEKTLAVQNCNENELCVNLWTTIDGMNTERVPL